MDRDERPGTPGPVEQPRRGAAGLRRQAALGTLAAALLLLPAAAEAQTGPSFDCGRARTRVEKAICADAGLAAADRQMADLYRARLAERPGEAGQPIRDAQAAWLRRRAQCEALAEASPALTGCVRTAIDGRVAELRPPPAAASTPPAPPVAPREQPVPRAAAAWQVTGDGDTCTASRSGPKGRRFAIERRRAADADTPTFHPGAGDQDLILPGDRAVFLVEQQRLPATVVAGPPPAIVAEPGSESAAMRTILAGRSLAVVRQLDTLLEVPLDGLAEAMAELDRRRCSG